MARKRYARPEVVLQRAITGLESDDERSHQRAVLSLLTQGPLQVSDEVLQRPQPSPIGLVRAELLQFLRTIVRGDFAGRISVNHHVTFQARSGDGRVVCVADGRDARDLTMLQTVLLLHAVGLDSIRICRVTDCDKMFVKTYRREYCSSRCQKRDYMRQRRANAERQRAKRRLRKGV